MAILNHQLRARIADDEAELLEKLAAATGKSTSQVIRLLINSATLSQIQQIAQAPQPNPIRFLPPDDHLIDDSIARQIMA